MARTNTMINGVKLSDPIINYPSLREFSFEEIDQWLTDNQADTYLIKFYVHYINKTILILFLKKNNIFMIIFVELKLMNLIYLKM